MTTPDFTRHPVTFDEMADSLVELGCTNHPSEIHGLLCGLLAAGQRLTRDQWLQQVSALAGDKALEGTCSKLVHALYAITLEALETSDFAITLLLPDEDEALEQRAEALGIWCQSFLSGFGEGMQQKKPGEEVESTLNDFSAIAQIQSTIDDSDDAERDWLEVSEYVRMALLMIFVEMNAQNVNKTKEPATLH
ncbi:UPF0149 family protein [Endozoicomonas sp. Mp262]|uniref:UPF0149 family protein n=1 Tax=Endozoicomonas sp. Mp262 TaxID=2919499 RepID=UPI0021DA9D63